MGHEDHKVHRAAAAGLDPSAARGRAVPSSWSGVNGKVRDKVHRPADISDEGCQGQGYCPYAQRHPQMATCSVTA